MCVAAWLQGSRGLLVLAVQDVANFYVAASDLAATHL